MGNRKCRFQIIIEIFWPYITSDRSRWGGILNGAAGETLAVFLPVQPSSAPRPEWSARRRGLGAFMCSEQLCRSKSIQIEVCSSFTPTNRDLISKMLARLFYTKKPAGRGCNRWREVGWKANLGDAYVLRVPLGLPWVGRIWQKRSVQQKNPPLCLSMGY